MVNLGRIVGGRGYFRFRWRQPGKSKFPLLTRTNQMKYTGYPVQNISM